MPSDSNYAAVTRFRRPHSIFPPVWLDEDIVWRHESLPNDEIDVQRHESAVAPLLEEGELDADAIVVTPAGNSSAAANHAAERRRRDERWTDIGLDQLLLSNDTPATNDAANRARNNQGTTGSG